MNLVQQAQTLTRVMQSVVPLLPQLARPMPVIPQHLVVPQTPVEPHRPASTQAVAELPRLTNAPTNEVQIPNGRV